MENQELTKSCSFCREMFIASRKTAKFCSNTCRTKANNQRRENEKIEAQKAIEQAELDELKRKASEARKLKKDEKAIAVAEKQRLEEKERQDKKDKEVADLAEKQRIADEAIVKQRLKEEADKKQRLEEEERKKKADKELHDRKLKAAQEIGKALGEWLANRSTNVSNSNNGTQKSQIEPVIKIPPTNQLKPENPSMPYYSNPTNQGFNSSGSPPLNALNKPVISNKPGLAPQNKQHIHSLPINNPGHKPVVDEILDCIHIFK